MSECDLSKPVCLEEDGLRETFLAGLPSEVREGLRQTTLGAYRLAARYGLLHRDSPFGQETARVVGLWRELDFLKQLAGRYERRAQGEAREGVRDIRVLLEEAEAQARRLLPEGIS